MPHRWSLLSHGGGVKERPATCLQMLIFSQWYFVKSTGTNHGFGAKRPCSPSLRDSGQGACSAQPDLPSCQATWAGCSLRSLRLLLGKDWKWALGPDCVCSDVSYGMGVGVEMVLLTFLCLDIHICQMGIIIAVAASVGHYT